MFFRFGVFFFKSIRSTSVVDGERAFRLNRFHVEKENLRKEKQQCSSAHSMYVVARHNDIKSSVLISFLTKKTNFSAKRKKNLASEMNQSNYPLIETKHLLFLEIIVGFTDFSTTKRERSIQYLLLFFTLLFTCTTSTHQLKRELFA